MEIHVLPYFPEGVRQIIASGGTNYVGLVDEHTVLKYPHFPGELVALEIEAKILEAAGYHPRVVEFKGKNANGLLLGFARNGSLNRYLQHASPPIQQKLKWSKQAAEALTHVHEKHIIHCDINVNNLLLDECFNIKLCDFQGRLLSSDGSIAIDGGASENVKSRMPRPDYGHVDHRTDIFALGSTIYHIMRGHDPFPELDPFQEKDELEIVKRFKSCLFPDMSAAMAGNIVHKCWRGEYASARDILHDLEKLVGSS